MSLCLVKETECVQNLYLEYYFPNRKGVQMYLPKMTQFSFAVVRWQSILVNAELYFYQIFKCELAVALVGTFLSYRKLPNPSKNNN